MILVISNNYMRMSIAPVLGLQCGLATPVRRPFNL